MNEPTATTAETRTPDDDATVRQLVQAAAERAEGKRSRGQRQPFVNVRLSLDQVRELTLMTTAASDADRYAELSPAALDREHADRLANGAYER